MSCPGAWVMLVFRLRKLTVFAKNYWSSTCLVAVTSRELNRENEACLWLLRLGSHVAVRNCKEKTPASKGKRTTHASTNLPRERILWDAVFAPGVSKQAGGLVMRIMTLVLYVGALPQSPTQREPDRPWKRNSHRPDSRYSAVTPWLGLG